jgi:dipeptide/tripeptide permease
MPQGNHITEFKRLHEIVDYVVADDGRKDAISTIVYVGWIVSGLVILFLTLVYGREAAMIALLAIAIAGTILWLLNSWWRRRLYLKYSPDSKKQQQLHTEQPHKQQVGTQSLHF